MKIHTNTGGPVATNGYLLSDENAKVAAIIDAPRDTIAPLLKIVEHNGWDVRYLLFTHGHWDHIGDHAIVTAAFPAAKILMHRLEEPRLVRPSSALFPVPFHIPPRQADGYLEDNQKLELGDMTLEMLFTPGHAPGHIAIFIASQKVLFAGDLLFAQSVGRTDLPGSDAAAMRTSLHRVASLPDDTKVLSGHGPQTTIGQEKRVNPWLKDL